MKETSRGRFAKQFTGAMATLLILAFSAMSGANAQPRDQAKGRETAIEEIKTSHDTPPPIIISDGSLVVESQDQFDESTAGGRFLYKGPSTQKPDIGHIRILQDNGEKIYEDLNAKGSKIVIVWINEDKNVTGDVMVFGGSAFTISSDKNLMRQQIPKRRKHQYNHPGSGGNRRIRIESIEVENPRGLKTRFTAAPTGTGAAFLPDDLRILIWRH